MKIRWLLRGDQICQVVELETAIRDPDEDYSCNAYGQDSCSTKPYDQMMSLQCSYPVTKDNNVKKVLAYPRINIDQDYDDTKEGNNIQNDYMHISIRRSQKKKG